MISEPYILVKAILEKTEEASTHQDQHKHYKLYLSAAEHSYTVAVNVYSYEEPHALRYHAVCNYKGELVNEVIKLADGLYSDLGQGADSLAIDYLRGGLFDVSQMTKLSRSDVAGPKKLISILNNWCQQAIHNPCIKVCVWGKGFSDDSGVHDVHMNQGNQGKFAKENAIWQDGAVLFIEETQPSALGALFLSFQSQCLRTDGQGNCIK